DEPAPGRARRPAGHRRPAGRGPPRQRPRAPPRPRAVRRGVRRHRGRPRPGAARRGRRRRRGGHPPAHRHPRPVARRCPAGPGRGRAGARRPPGRGPRRGDAAVVGRGGRASWLRAGAAHDRQVAPRRPPVLRAAGLPGHPRGLQADPL
ncbi:MAG: Transcriptional regulator, partial [uncultured Nocardioides sp.]